jgi:aarF domain-containing kinase
MFDFVRRGRRSARVARTGATIYLGYKRTQRKVRKLDAAAAEAAWEHAHTVNAERLYRMAVDLKGLYIKGGQFLGTRSDVVPAPYSKSLSRLQDSVPPRPIAQVRATIEAEFGRPIAELFATFDDTPLGAASLAQVHRATLADGRQVVAKVQYPEVGALVRLDIRNMRTLVGIVARREPNFDYRAIVNEIGVQVPLELDFVREADMTRRIGANLSGLPDVMVPRVVDSLVSGRVLVTEYIDGARLLDAERLSRMAIDRAQLARTIASAYGHQILVDGLFQADPHPGNILVLEGGRVALLDFGLTKELPDASRLGFARLVVGAADRDPAAIMAAFADLGVRTKSDDPAALLALTSVFFDSRPLTERPAGLAQQRRATRQNPVEAIPGDLVLLGRVVGLLRGVCASLGSPLSPMQMLRPYAEAALAGAGGMRNEA